MPVAVQARKLTDDVLNDNLNSSVSEELYEASVKPLLKDLAKYGITKPGSITFDPSKHLLFTDAYYEKTKCLTLEDIGVSNPHQDPISPIAVSEPFPLFTEEAIAIMRWELFQKENFLHTARINEHSNTGATDYYVRGFASKLSPFTFEAWKHPKVLEIISTMAGVELVHMIDYEIGHVNLHIKDQSQVVDPAVVEIIEDDKNTDAKELTGVVSWHYDSPQFVCVLMMCDTTDMTGGETALLTGTGEVARVAGPKMGWANVLQGRILRHMGTKPSGSYRERTTAVCSMRPKDHMLDNAPISTIKPSELSGSRWNDFYAEYMDYRIEVLTKRLETLKTQIHDKIARGEKFDQLETIEFLQKKIVEYAEHTWQEFEVVDDGLVEKPKSYHFIEPRFK